LLEQGRRAEAHHGDFQRSVCPHNAEGAFGGFHIVRLM
jgi:hypothetical protein